MKKRLLSISFLLLSAFAGNAEAAVWADTNRWDQQWEDRYADWIKSSFNEDIFTKGKYKNISTDCADAVYTSRAIFAYENQLPFVILDPTGGGSKISNRMSRFDGEGSSISRFRAFVDYVNEMTDTKTLPRDTYPIAITREYLRSGAVWSRVRITTSNVFSMIFGGRAKEDPGHAEIVKDVTDTGAIELIGSTVPSEVRSLMTTSSLVFMPEETSTGFRKWMEPDWYGAAEKDLPGYSLEQFKLGARESNNYNNESPTFQQQQGTARTLDEWQKQIQEKLQLRSENKDEALYRYGANLCTLIQARVATILKSEKTRNSLNGECMNAEDYDSYSTPSRDKRINTTIENMVSMGGGFGFTVSGRIDNVAQYMDKCPPIQIGRGQSLSLFEIVKAYADDKVSSNPNDSFEARWGLATGDGESRCPTY
jgi:hypothetical protein